MCCCKPIYESYNMNTYDRTNTFSHNFDHFNSFYQHTRNIVQIGCITVDRVHTRIHRFLYTYTPIRKPRMMLRSSVHVFQHMPTMHALPVQKRRLNGQCVVPPTRSKLSPLSQTGALAPMSSWRCSWD